MNKYLFSGKLVLKTGLHIGGGHTGFSISDSPVIRTPDDKPFIPGSSFKGAFRSTVEKLAATIGLKSCLLEDGNLCVTPQKGKLGKAYRLLRGFEGQIIRPDNTEAVEALEVLERPDIVGERLTEEDLWSMLVNHLCDTCNLFGSPYTASKINFSDLYTGDDTEGLIQVRDGVAIDRDSERAADSFLYNYEVVAPSLAFDLEIWLEDPSAIDLGLTCLGLSEFLSGFGYLGGKRSRGLGQCELQALKIYELDLSGENNAERLLTYLRGRTPEEKMESVEQPESFVNQKIEILIAEGNHA